MFKNVGKKIKLMAKICTWFGIICSCLIGLAIIILSFVTDAHAWTAADGARTVVEDTEEVLNDPDSTVQDLLEATSGEFEIEETSDGGITIKGIELNPISGIIIGVLIAVLGSFSAWLSNIVLYGFGELIDKTAEIARNTEKK